MSKAIPVVIDRSRWSRRTDDSLLLDWSTGKMCCLGFCARALGITDDEISGCGLPSAMPPAAWEKWCEHTGWEGGNSGCATSPRTSRAVSVNDASGDEAHLTELLAPWFTLEFVDGPVES